MNQARKKVLYLITKATWGGAQRYVYDFAINLPQTEFETTVAYGERGVLAGRLEKVNIKTHRITNLGRDIAFISDISSFFQILIYLWRTKPDIVHLNSSKAAALGALAARLCGIRKIVFTVHGWPFKEHRNVLWRLFAYSVSWITAVMSHSVIVVSKADEASGKRMPLVAHKMFYIPIGIEPPAFLMRDEALELFSKKYGFTKSIFSIVTIAELTSNKGISYAIEAVALLEKSGINVHYFIIGSGEKRAHLEVSARNLNVADRVHFLGFVENAAWYLKAFDIFLLPSIKEGMPYVLLEAAAAGLPIITTTVVNPDVVDRYENIRTVPPANTEAIANAIVETLQTRLESGLFPAGKQFSLTEMLAKTFALYR